MQSPCQHGNQLPSAAVRSHPPTGPSFKGIERRDTSLPKGAAARSRPSASAKAAASADSDWETF